MPVTEAAVDGDLLRHLVLLVRLDEHRLGHDLAGVHQARGRVRDLVALGEAALNVHNSYNSSQQYQAAANQTNKHHVQQADQTFWSRVPLTFIINEKR